MNQCWRVATNAASEAALATKPVLRRESVPGGVPRLPGRPSLLGVGPPPRRRGGVAAGAVAGANELIMTFLLSFF